MATDFGNRLRAAQKHAKKTQQQVAKEVGMGQGTLSELMKIGTGSAFTTKIARACGVDAHWLATGEGEMLPTPLALLGKPVRALAEVDDSVEGQVHVPLLANAGSMGAGNDLLHDDVLVGHIALSETWVARRLQPTSQNALRFIHAYGDSMSPTFEDGDVLLVDTGMRDPKAIDGVYVMAANDRLYVKRVRQRLDGSVEISSDNANVKTVDVLNGGSAIEVLGRVVWCWNGRKL